MLLKAKPTHHPVCTIAASDRLGANKVLLVGFEAQEHLVVCEENCRNREGEGLGKNQMRRSTYKEEEREVNRVEL